MKLRIVFILLSLMLLSVPALAQDTMLDVEAVDVDIMSDGLAYESFVAAPAEEGPYPGIILIHSFNGLEQGYRDMTEAFAAEGFVVLAVGWQTFERSPSDDTVMQLVADGIDYLETRDDVDPERIGLTGFCAGGRYTMLFLPQMEQFGAGVAWYGFPFNGNPSAADLIDNLDVPMLVIHSTADIPSPIATIYEYLTLLDEAGKSFELKVYADEPHGFMLQDGELRTDEVAGDAYNQMVDYFHRKLG